MCAGGGSCNRGKKPVLSCFDWHGQALRVSVHARAPQASVLEASLQQSQSGAVNELSRLTLLLGNAFTPNPSSQLCKPVAARGVAVGTIKIHQFAFVPWKTALLRGLALCQKGSQNPSKNCAFSANFLCSRVFVSPEAQRFEFEARQPLPGISDAEPPALRA